MMTWLKRIRAAVALGLIWGLTWGVVGGFVMEAIVDPHGRIIDMWPQTLAIPGFLGGVVFSVVLWMASGRRKFSELSYSRLAAYGAVTGLALCGLGIGLFGMSTVWRAALIAAPVTLLTAASAAGSLALARWGERRALLDANVDAPDARLGRSDDDLKRL